MNVFLKNANFRQLMINQWISTMGDTIFYLAFINYISSSPHASLAVFLITLSETLPQIFQIIMGVFADFQTKRIKKYALISIVKFFLYLIVAALFWNNGESLLVVAVVCAINFVSDTLGFFSGSMLTPIFMKLIGEDISSAIGFRQATTNIVRTVSNLIGGVLIGVINIQILSLLNATTFLLAFIGLLLIKNSLQKVENTIHVHSELDSKVFGRHLLESVKMIFKMDSLMKILGVLSLSQAILNVVTPVSVLLISKNPIGVLTKAQSLTLLTSAPLVSLLIGNFMTSYLKKIFTTKRCLVYAQVMEFIIIVGFMTSNLYLILVGIIGDSFMTGITVPRFQEMVFSVIPEDKMGAIQSTIGSITIVLPSLLSMLLISVATGLGIVYMSYLLMLLLMIGIMLLMSIKNVM